MVFFYKSRPFFWDYPFFRRPIKRVIRKEVGLFFKPTFFYCPVFPVAGFFCDGVFYPTLFEGLVYEMKEKFSNFATPKSW